jgi:hypothetical protein
MALNKKKGNCMNRVTLVAIYFVCVAFLIVGLSFLVDSYRPLQPCTEFMMPQAKAAQDEGFYMQNKEAGSDYISYELINPKTARLRVYLLANPATQTDKRVEDSKLFTRLGVCQLTTKDKAVVFVRENDIELQPVGQPTSTIRGI